MNRRRERTIGIHLFVALLLGAVALGAEEPPLPSAFGTSVDVRVVNVEAVVTDRDGRPVHGLTAADFRLLVDGRETPVEYFAEVGAGAGNPDPSSPAPAAKGRSFLVFIDDLFGVAQQRNEVLKGIERDLRLLGPEDRMAIVAFYRQRLEVLSGWTGDREALAAVLRAARERPARGNHFLAGRRSDKEELDLVSTALAASDPDGSGAMEAYSGLNSLASAVTPPEGVGEVYSSLRKVSSAAVAALQALAPASGRRMMLLLSGGWIAPQPSLSVLMEANRLGYTLYPLDVEGMDRVFGINDAADAGPRPSTGFVRSGYQQMVERGLETMARMTGGRVLLGQSRFSALERALEDSGSWYALGFTPEWKGDGHNHRIEIEIRRKGLAVRSRKGFSDLSRSTRAALAARAVLLAGGPPQDKRLAVEAGKPARKGSEMTLPLTVAIPFAGLTPVRQGNLWVVEATLALCAVDGKDATATSDLIEAPLRLSLPSQPRPEDFARYRTTLKLRYARQRLVLTVRDPLGGGVLWGEATIEP